METFVCAKCKSVEDELTRFPGSLCLACWERKMEGQPIERPDFSRIFKK